MKYLFISLTIFILCCKPASKISISENNWVLIELNGNPVTANSAMQKAPHIIFRSAENKFNGNTGCNTMAGKYEIKDRGRISLSDIITTKMACMNGMEQEGRFLKALQEADNYVITGDTLALNKARMAPLARFKSIYLK